MQTDAPVITSAGVQPGCSPARTVVAQQRHRLGHAEGAFGGAQRIRCAALPRLSIAELGVEEVGVRLGDINVDRPAGCGQPRR